jgi:hypothetical protein
MSTSNTSAPHFLGAVLVPWRLASILFIAISSTLLAFFQGKGVVGIVGSYFLLSWLFKYAFVMLEHVASGRPDAPVVSAEMLGPFEQRPLILVAWCSVLYVIAGSSVVRSGWPWRPALCCCCRRLLPCSVWGWESSRP